MKQTQIRKTVAIFCSADVNVSDALKREALSIGKYLGEKKYEILLGGTESGLMRSVADGYLVGVEEDLASKSLKIIIPEMFRKYVDAQHTKVCIDEIVWVDTVRDQLETFEKLAHNVVILPGGFGTFLELFNFLAHKKNLSSETNVYLFNSNGFFDHLLLQLDVMVKENTLRKKERDSLIVLNSIEDLKNFFI